MIVATAGHIDHGKTRLVRALTGVDTDTLPEEQARGISIDLGFAYWTTPEGWRIGFVDVPGHERFVKNMVAGVAAVDFVLLVVAADDGVMPQTVEHLRIVELLGVRRGAVVITKVDRVDAARREAVAMEVRTLLRGTALAEVAIQPTSTVTGEGLPELRALLRSAAAEVALRVATHARHFRYTVDRAFTVKGSGTIVTGTVLAGLVRVGDHVVVTPGGDAARVRGIQKQGVEAHEVAAGERGALNLHGLPLERVGRGQWLVAEALHAPGQRIDVHLQLLASENKPLAHWTPVLLHHGTASVVARVAVRRSAPVAPGAASLVQLRTEQPIAPVHGDRFIVRDASATRTIGGGVVVDPQPPTRTRMTAQRERLLDAWRADHDAVVVARLLACSPLGVDLGQVERGLNLTRASLHAIVEACDGIVLGRARSSAWSKDAIEALRQRALAALAKMHEASPAEPWIAMDALRRIVAVPVGEDVFATLLREWEGAGGIEVRGGGVRRTDWKPSPIEDDPRWLAIRRRLQESGYDAPTVAELSAMIGVPGAALIEVLHHRSREKQVYAVSPQRFYLRATLRELATMGKAVADAHPQGIFTAAEFRDRTGIGRNLGIEILECLDRLGITRRMGNARKFLRDPASVLEGGEDRTA